MLKLHDIPGYLYAHTAQEHRAESEYTYVDPDSFEDK